MNGWHEMEARRLHVRLILASGREDSLLFYFTEHPSVLLI
jgi:hypothetical protein